MLPGNDPQKSGPAKSTCATWTSGASAVAALPAAAAAGSRITCPIAASITRRPCPGTPCAARASSTACSIWSATTTTTTDASSRPAARHTRVRSCASRVRSPSKTDGLSETGRRKTCLPQRTITSRAWHAGTDGSGIGAEVVRERLEAKRSQVQTSNRNASSAIDARKAWVTSGSTPAGARERNLSTKGCISSWTPFRSSATRVSSSGRSSVTECHGHTDTRSDNRKGFAPDGTTAPTATQTTRDVTCTAAAAAAAGAESLNKYGSHARRRCVGTGS